MSMLGLGGAVVQTVLLTCRPVRRHRHDDSAGHESVIKQPCLTFCMQTSIRPKVNLAPMWNATAENHQDSRRTRLSPVPRQ
jgi:hypothetical protein